MACYYHEKSGAAYDAGWLECVGPMAFLCETNRPGKFLCVGDTANWHEIDRDKYNKIVGNKPVVSRVFFVGGA